MKLQFKLLIYLGTVLLATFAMVEIIGYQQTREHMIEQVRNEARQIRAVMMSTRRIYQQQFLNSEIPLEASTLGFLPAHAMSRSAAALSDEAER